MREDKNASETEDLRQRVDGLHEILENLRGTSGDRSSSTEVALTSPALQTILARQSLLMSAVFQLTELVEDLTPASGKRRRPEFGSLDTEVVDLGSVPQRPAAREPGAPGGYNEAPARSRPETVALDSPAAPDGGFGALRRRRRRGVIGLLAVLALTVCLLLAPPTFIDGEDPQSGASNPRDAQGPPPEARDQAAVGPTASGGREAGNAADGENAEGQVASVSTPEAPGTSGDGVPDVSGRSIEEAARLLGEGGLTVAAIKTVSSAQRAGTVVRTEPAAGSPIRSDTPVVLVMSGGRGDAPPESPG